MTLPLHPAHLRARAALATFAAALDVLDHRATEEDRAIAAEQATAPSLLKSPSWGRRRALGGHADPVGGTSLADIEPEPARTNHYAALRLEIREQLHGVAQHLPPAGRLGDVYRIHQAIPAMSPTAADACRMFLDRLDGRIRRQLVLHADRQLVPRVPCPTCDTVGLSMRLAPSPAERVVECMTCGAAWLWSDVTRSQEAAA